MPADTHMAITAHRHANTHADTDIRIAPAQHQAGDAEQQDRNSFHIFSHRLLLLPHSGHWCKASIEPDGSATTAIVPSRKSAEGGINTVPPKSATRSAAAAGSVTAK